MTERLSPSRRAVIGGAIGLAAASALPAAAQDALAAKGYALGDVVKGDPNAPVKIVEYASLTCPHCATFHKNAYPRIKADYIDTGKAHLIMREVYFDKFGLWSSAIARCGGSEAYYPIIDMMLNDQSAWYGDHVRAYQQTNNHQPILDEMRKIGRKAGLSNERMNACLEDRAFFERLVADFQETSAEDGVRSTPTFFINGEQIVGAVSADEMARVIESFL
ncbi:MAG: DsbA family protein [Pseudomonadota bacterium]